MTIRLFCLSFLLSLQLVIYADFTLSNSQPYDDLEILQVEVINNVCRKFEVIPAGFSSSCFTAIRNIYFSFKSKAPLYEDQAQSMICEIMIYIHELVNKDDKISLIKINEIIDANFLHIALFFDLAMSSAECSIDIINGWINHQIYNYYGNGSILKIKRPLYETLPKSYESLESILLPDYAKFINSAYFTTHLLSGQSFAQLFIDFGETLSRKIEDLTGLCNVEMEDRACNAVESCFGKVRKLFFYGEWSDQTLIYPKDIRPIFMKTAGLILEEINKSEDIKQYLSTFPFKIEDIELVIRPNYHSEDTSKHISSVYNIKNNIIYILCEDKYGGGKISTFENYYDNCSI